MGGLVQGNICTRRNSAFGILGIHAARHLHGMVDRGVRHVRLVGGTGYVRSQVGSRLRIDNVDGAVYADIGTDRVAGARFQTKRGSQRHLYAQIICHVQQLLVVHHLTAGNFARQRFGDVVHRHIAGKRSGKLRLRGFFPIHGQRTCTAVRANYVRILRPRFHHGRLHVAITEANRRLPDDCIHRRRAGCRHVDLLGSLLSLLSEAVAILVAPIFALLHPVCNIGGIRAAFIADGSALRLLGAA